MGETHEWIENVRQTGRWKQPRFRRRPGEPLVTSAMEPWMLTAAEEGTVRSEYARLCTALGLQQATLDVYEPDTEAGPEVQTTHGTQVRNDTAGYTPSGNQIILPIDDRAALLRATTFPPANWNKMDDEWPLWRIELWHEVVHQVSATLGVYDHHEVGHQMAGARFWTTEGHGAGWLKGVARVASIFHVSIDVLESLVIAATTFGPPKTSQVDS